MSSSICRLLSDEPETLYWIGFILADGYIHNNVRLKISLGIKDYNHLQKFAEYVSLPSKVNVYTTKSNFGEFTSCSVSIQDKIYIPQITSKFMITNNKTTNPPDFGACQWLTNEQAISLIVGFTDGDGSITKLQNRNDVNIRYKCHNTWFENLKWISKVVSDVFGGKQTMPRVNKDGYAYLTFSNMRKICIPLKEVGVKLNLPILERKWNKIDLERTFSGATDKKTVVLNGKTFSSINEAERETGVSKYLIRKHYATFVP